MNEDDYDHCSLIELGTPSNLISVSNKGSESVQSADISKWPLLLKLHGPNQAYQHLPHNLAGSGWDIICAPSVGSSPFQSLVTSGACPIGLLEDARAQLEAYPPLPIFPRDFPDTEDGKLYWEQCPKSAATAKEEEEKRKDESLSSWKDWTIIRACIEGSWGRNNTNTMLKRTKRHWKQDANTYAKEQIRKGRKYHCRRGHTSTRTCFKGKVFITTTTPIRPIMKPLPSNHAILPRPPSSLIPPSVLVAWERLSWPETPPTRPGRPLIINEGSSNA